MTLRERILASDDIPSETHPLPKAWGEGSVLVKGLTAGELSDFVRKYADQAPKLQNAELLILCLKDPETGKPLFEQADRDGLVRKAAGPFMQLVRIAQRLAGLIPDEGAVSDLKAGDTSG